MPSLCRYLILHTDILKYTSVKTRLFGVNDRFPATPMTNHNHLLGKIDGVDGLKTGFTNGAGFCLATTAQRSGHRIIVVLMDSPDARTRDLKVAELIDRGFASIPVFGPNGALGAPAPRGPPALRPDRPPSVPGSGLSAPDPSGPGFAPPTHDPTYP